MSKHEQPLQHLLDEALGFFGQEQYFDAIMVFTKVIDRWALRTDEAALNEWQECGATLAQVYQHRAYAWFKCHEYDIAVMDINHAIRLTPADAVLYSVRGKLYRESVRYGSAILDLTLAITLDPYSYEYWYERSLTHSKDENWEAALGDIEKAIQLAGGQESPELFVQRAHVYYQTGQRERSLEDCLRVQHADLSPEDCCLCGEVYLDMGDHVNALEMFGRAGLEHTETHLGLARYHFNQNDFDKAVTLCTAYLATHPKSHEALLLRGQSHYRCGQHDDAKRDLKRVVEHDRDNEEACKTFIHVFLDIKDHKSAEEWQHKADAIAKRKQQRQSQNTGASS